MSGAAPNARTALLALATANARYWSSVYPLVRHQLSRWETAAGTLPSAGTRTLAVGKLRSERFNVELAATFAVLAPRARRSLTVQASVALQVLYDFLDALGERRGGEEASAEGALVLAVALDREPDEYDPYAAELARTAKDALRGLPAAEAVRETALVAAQRCAKAQSLYHSAAGGPSAELEEWCRSQARETPLGWREWLAGAQASVLCLHALAAAAANPRTTHSDAQRLDSLYLSIGSLTMLDGLVDADEDRASGEPGYARFYDSPDCMAEGLAQAARDVFAQAAGLSAGTHHAVAALTGVVAYYATAPTAASPPASTAIERLRSELGPALVPALCLMRAWRMAKRVRAHPLHVPDAAPTFARARPECYRLAKPSLGKTRRIRRMNRPAR